jgi:hypothetical protein
MGSLVYICPATGEEVSTGYIAEYEDGSSTSLQFLNPRLSKVYLMRGGTASLASLLTNGSRMGT